MYLGIETSGAISSVALMDEDGQLRGEMTVSAGLTHSEQLIPHMDMLLKASKVAKTDITGIAVSIGPGSFTGLRIGIATAKSLAYVWQVPLIGVMSMQAWAHCASLDERTRSIVIDAQKRQVYEGKYRLEQGKLVEVQAPVVKQRDELADEYAHSRDIIVMGDALKHMQKVLHKRDDVAHLALMPPVYNVVRASHVLLAAYEDFQTGRIPEFVEPYYIRRSEAEVLWEAKHPELANDPNRIEPTVEVRETAGEVTLQDNQL